MRSITASCPWKLAPKRGDELARQRAAKRKAQYEVEMLALEWSKIMLRRQIDDAINPATDPRLRRDLYNDVLNRGFGRPKPEEDRREWLEERRQPRRVPGNAGSDFERQPRRRRP